MKLRWPLLLAPLAVLGAFGTFAQQPSPAGIESSEDAQAALDRARQQGAEARSRAEALEANAARATAEADRTAQEGAALAARVQESEARIAANEAQIRLIGREQAVLRAELAEKQRPLVELTAALQRLARRPPLLSLLRPGSLRDAVYLRAVLDTLLPEVARRTAGLREAIARGKALQERARAANEDLRSGQADLARRRAELTALEGRQRLASRAASASADRESERALALAEQARDLSGLVVDLAKAGALRDQLAALPGPVLRPAQPQNAQSKDASPLATAEAAAAPTPGAPTHYLMPAAGRLVAGFGESRPGQAASRGLSIMLAGGAQVVAPAAGRVAFAGPYKGYGLIVIVEHAGGWTSLVTGLADIDCRVGDNLVGGAPLGRMGPGRPILGFELRRGGQPVNPLDFIRP